MIYIVQHLLPHHLQGDDRLCDVIVGGVSPTDGGALGVGIGDIGAGPTPSPATA